MSDVESSLPCPATSTRSTAQGGDNERDCLFCHVTTDSALLAHPQTGRMIKLTADEVAAMGCQFPTKFCKDHYEYLYARHLNGLRATYADNAFAEYWHSKESSKERQDKLITGMRTFGAFVVLFVAGGAYMYFADPLGLHQHYADPLEPHRHYAQERRRPIIQVSGIEKS